jgi:hypothetical protein
LSGGRLGPGNGCNLEGGERMIRLRSPH